MKDPKVLLQEGDEVTPELQNWMKYLNPIINALSQDMETRTGQRVGLVLTIFNPDTGEDGLCATNMPSMEDLPKVVTALKDASVALEGMLKHMGQGETKQ